MKDKGSLRTYFLELLKKQTSADIKAKSGLIEQKLLNHTAFQKAKTIMFYASLPGEVDTLEMIRKAIELKKNICVPVVVKNQKAMIPISIKKLADLKNGVYGIPQPNLDASLQVSLKDIDTVIVPGLAFDKLNNRLGRGAGYYDRFLSQRSANTTTIGLGFDFQLTDSLPVEEHDVPLSCVITN